MRKIDLSDCGVKVKSAGGTYLDVKGKVFLDMDFGHSLRAGAPFAVVKNLGVPALLGMSSMTRIGMDLCLRKKPYHIKMSDPQDKEKTICLPINAHVGEILQSFLNIFEGEVMEAIAGAEDPMASKKFQDQDFGLWGEVVVQNFF
jgi:hypothetical protein